jgi:hypothetical protein
MMVQFNEVESKSDFKFSSGKFVHLFKVTLSRKFYWAKQVAPQTLRFSQFFTVKSDDSLSLDGDAPAANGARTFAKGEENGVRRGEIGLTHWKN